MCITFTNTIYFLFAVALGEAAETWARLKLDII